VGSYFLDGVLYQLLNILHFVFLEHLHFVEDAQLLLLGLDAVIDVFKFLE